MLNEDYTLVLSKDDYEAVVKSLEEPPKANDKLVDLMKRKAPWEEKDNE